jgi:predicted DCC family thiol-disulfide oxidoreductase YuxK
MAAPVATASPPERPTVVFDGACAFCRRWVARVQRLDRAGTIRFLPRQDPSAPVVSNRSPKDLSRAAHFVRGDGAVFAGAAAAREMWLHLPGANLVRLLTRVPGTMVFAEWLYGWIARRFGPVR